MARRLGAAPSVGNIMEAVQAIFTMLERQTHIEHGILDTLTYSSSDAELQAALRFFKGMFQHHPSVTKPWMHRLSVGKARFSHTIT
jgi:hypothetical protein